MHLSASADGLRRCRKKASLRNLVARGGNGHRSVFLCYKDGTKLGAGLHRRHASEGRVEPLCLRGFDAVVEHDQAIKTLGVP